MNKADRKKEAERKRQEDLERARLQLGSDPSAEKWGAFLNANAESQNVPVAAKRAEDEAKAEAEDSSAARVQKGLGLLGDVVSGYTNPLGTLLSKGLDATFTPKIEGKLADPNKPAPGKRYGGFLDLNSRGVRQAAGYDEENPGDIDLEYGFLDHAAVIDAKADQELLDNNGEPGFWNMYSGLHNLAGKSILSYYGVSGA